MKIKNKFLYFYISIFALFLSLSFSANAFTLAQPIPGVSNSGGVTEGTTFAEYVVGIMPFIFGLAAVIAVTQLVIGGMQYALSEGLTSKEDAKDRIWAAIWGLLLALLSWLILNTINPNLVNPSALDISALPAGNGVGFPNALPKTNSPVCFGDGDCSAGYTCDKIVSNTCIQEVIINNKVITTQPSGQTPPKTSAPQVCFGPTCPTGFTCDTLVTNTCIPATR